jgi:hypothetical protein
LLERGHFRNPAASLGEPEGVWGSDQEDVD